MNNYFKCLKNNGFLKSNRKLITFKPFAKPPPERFQWPTGAFRKNLKIWNLLKSVQGYIWLTEFLALDKANLHKNNE